MLFTRKPDSHLDPMPAPADARDRMHEPAPMVRPPAQQPVRAPVDAMSGADGSHTQSFIDASLTIVGDLHSEGDVRIDGRICGNVRCAQLILGRDAAITGSVTAEQAIVRGRIIGTIRAPVVVIQESAHVESEIHYGSLTIDDGAFFEGTVHRRTNPLAEEPAAPPLLPHAPEPADPAPDRAPSKAPAANGHAPIANGHT